MIPVMPFGSGGWSDTLLAGLLAFALRASVLLAVAWLATRALRRASAATRHVLWTAAIVGVLTLPLLQSVVPAWTVPVLSLSARIAPPAAGMESMRPRQPMPDVVSPAASPVAPLRQPETSRPASATGTATETATETASSPAVAAISPRATMAIAWLAVVVLLLCRLAVANARLSGWRRGSRAVEEPEWTALLRRLTREYGIDRPVLLLESDDTDVPVTWGIVYPVVLLPAGAARWDAEQRRAVLTHELAHVKRFDALTQLLAQVALALLWFDPLVWIAARRMRQEREHACDDFVLAAGARASRYADDLLGLARRLARPTAPAAAALAMARRSELEGRLLAILDPAVKRTAVRRARVAMSTIGVVLLAVPLAALRPGVRVQTEPRVAASAQSSQAIVDSGSRAEVTTASSSNVESEPVSDSGALESLTRRVRSLTPSTLPGLRRIEPGLLRLRSDTEPPRPIDIETLVEVTKAAKRMTSDHEKGELLALIAKRYQRSDALRDAYLEAVLTMTGDHERSRALIALLDRDALPLTAVAKVLRTTAMMTSDVNKGMVLQRISPVAFADSSVQRAYVDALGSMTGDVERAGAITFLVKQPNLSQQVQLGLLQAAGAITANVEKAGVLLLFLERQGIADEKVRKAFFSVAGSLTSDTDYRRVMTAVMR